MKQLDYKIEKIDDNRVQIWFGDVALIVRVPLKNNDREFIRKNCSENISKEIISILTKEVKNG